MAAGDDETSSGATVAARPGALALGEVTIHDKPGASPDPDPDPDLAAAAGEATAVMPLSPSPFETPRPTPVNPPREAPSSVPRSRETPSLGGRSIIPTSAATTMTTAADAMRDEEVERTRLIIRMGWMISIVSIGTVPVLDASRVMSAAFIGAMTLGLVVSFFFHRAFADPTKYTEKALLFLSVMCVVNAHVAVLYFGVFTVTPVIIVIGIHFVARTEAERAARYIYATALICYAAVVIPIITRIIDDPGVFRSDVVLTWWAESIGAVFVLGTYSLAYFTARAFRKASLESIEELQKATRLSSQREALMDELRADLERALRIGGPGRYTEQHVGDFKLGIVLGRGAMGEVYEAVHVATGEPAAVKLLRRELLTDPTHVARFLREVRASGSLDTPHAVKILDASGEGDSVPFLAMERLRGATLAEVLRKETKLSATEVAELVRQMGAGIDAAATAGIVHRDVKPQNVFREDGPARIWKILDFGVATLVEESSGTLTQGGVIGTPNYMAPEQAQGKRVDTRADVYAIAAVAYRALTGRHPFNAPDTPSLLYAVVHKMPARPGEVVEGLPTDLDRWFALALAKNPDDRFASGAEQAVTLTAALANELDAKLRKRADSLIRKHPWD